MEKSIKEMSDFISKFIQPILQKMGSWVTLDGVGGPKVWLMEDRPQADIHDWVPTPNNSPRWFSDVLREQDELDVLLYAATEEEVEVEEEEAKEEQIEERVEEAVRVGASDEETLMQLWNLQSLDLSVPKQAPQEAPKDLPICAICMEEMVEPKENTVRLSSEKLAMLGCGHEFHLECAMRWKTHSVGGECALCRARAPIINYW